MSGMFFLPLFGVSTPPEPAAKAEPTPEPQPRADVPTLADAVADIRRDMRNSLALQSKSASAPPPIIVVNWVELVVVMDHVGRTLETETP